MGRQAWGTHLVRKRSWTKESARRASRGVGEVEKGKASDDEEKADDARKGGRLDGSVYRGPDVRAGHFARHQVLRGHAPSAARQKPHQGTCEKRHLQATMVNDIDGHLPKHCV
jgi:hypothetical protein